VPWTVAGKNSEVASPANKTPFCTGIAICRCPQVGRQAELARSPDATADAFAGLKDSDGVPVDGEIPCGRQPGDTAPTTKTSRDGALMFSRTSTNYIWSRRVTESRTLSRI
jgi:hypothetical protein